MATPSVISSPCAACKMLRRRCGTKCMLAPYFPSDDIPKFATAHRIFGASNIIKLLQDLPPENRADAVSSMVYEASARIKDPVYGCAGIVSQMQSHISKLQTQLASAQAEILGMRLQLENLTNHLCLARTYSSSSCCSSEEANNRCRNNNNNNPVSSTESSEDEDYSDNTTTNDNNNMITDSYSSEEEDPIRLWESFCRDW